MSTPLEWSPSLSALDVAVAAFREAPVAAAIIETDATGQSTIVDVNRALTELVGSMHAQVVGRAPTDLIGGVEDLAQLLADGAARQGVEGYWLHANGHRMPVLFHGAVLHAEAAGFPRVAIVQVHELVHRRRTERALRESEKRVQEVVDNVDALIYIKRADGRFLLINRHFEEMFGVRREDAPLKTNFDFFPPAVAALYTANDKRALAAGGPIHVEEPRAEGGTWLSLKFPLFDEDGKPYAIAGISTDISDRSRAEAAVRQAKEEAERANRAKSEFLSRMSHELRTPLNSILGFGQLLQLEDLPTGAAQGIARIVKAARHLLALINEVLEISRIEAGRQSLSIQPVHACGPLTEALDLVRPLAAERGVELIQDLHAGLLAFVLADYQRLEQVLLNVLTNAVKYTEAGGTVRVWMQTDGDRLRYQIADTGTGMDAQELEKVFMPFERLGAERSDEEGTGLGLALSKSLIDAMRGTIGVERSVKGEGTVFFIELPMTDTPHDGLDFLFGPETSPFPDLVPLCDRTVLYIEDNPANFELVQGVFSRLGTVELISARQGETGIDLAVQHRPDLILLDLHLPDIDGEDVLRRLRRDARTSDIPVIVLSADAIPTQIQRVKALGANGYITKPFEIAGFARAVVGAMGEPPT